MALEIALCAAGFLLLCFGAEWLVKGSSSLAQSLGVTPIVIGLTVVAFGTSAPELVVSLVSAIGGKSMIAVGNVVGSNIANIALVLGLAALLRPIRCDRVVVRRDIPIMLGISLLLLGLCLNDRLSRIDGAVLFAGIVLYTLLNYRFSKAALEQVGAAPVVREIEKIGRIESRPKQLVLIVVGIAGVVGGAQLVVTSAVRIMEELGVSEKFIGLTMVAFGTSLPELATSVVAAIRKEMDISIGNLVGSNVFNILCVLGASALVRPIPIPGGFVESGLVIDYVVMFGTSALPFLFLLGSRDVRRGHGALLLLSYLSYVTYLIVRG